MLAVEVTNMQTHVRERWDGVNGERGGLQTLMSLYPHNHSVSDCSRD